MAGVARCLLHDCATQLQAGLVVVGSSHRGRYGRVFAGSEGSRVLHGAPCSVAVAPRGYVGEPQPRRIAVAYDGSPESEDALVAGIGLALLAGATLHTYTVDEPVSARPALAIPEWSTVMEDAEHRRARAAAVAERAQTLVP